ncbi:TrkA C-terminal domain-containing protein [Paenibacillus sepulcri]|uniref:TrkA C-terminal domain-containing protein n=1 Tax=Paenibacillus sepulcri TaxID=359917 RepID=A0ABS7C7P6_9BACL|nr:TrkA C-terminal domain-containing protein [Paenibacillus sepulcri]
MGFKFILIYFIIIFLVLEIAIILFRSTGLKREISRFQVVSMMTGTGFTTKESELILRHPVRRNIGMFLILFGVFSLAVIISSISAIMTESFHVPQLVWTAAVLGLLLLILRFTPVHTFLTKWLHGELQQSFDLKELPVSEIFEMGENDQFIDIPLFANSRHVGKRVQELLTDQYDINLLFIKRGKETIRKERLSTELRSGDLIYVYGNKADLANLFKEELAERDKQDHDENRAASLNE